MRLSINLDDYLSSYDSFRFCSELLDEYFTGYRYNSETQRYEKKFDGKSPFEDSYGVLVDNDDPFYYRVNGSQEYYKRLLQENYRTLYQLISIHINRAGEDLSWHDWYIIASNAYKMKGNISSLKYILQHFGDNPLTGTKGLYHDYTYDTDLQDGEDANVQYRIYRDDHGMDVHEITLSLNVSTQNADLSKYLLETLARELLIVEQSGATFDEQEFICVVVFKEYITYTFDYQLNRIVNLQDCKVLGTRIAMLDVNLPYDPKTFQRVAPDGHVYNVLEGYSYEEDGRRVTIPGYDPNYTPWITSYNYKDAISSVREEDIPYADLNTAVPLFTWTALGRLRIKPRTSISYVTQIDTLVCPTLIDASFYYKNHEKLGFNFGFTTQIASYKAYNEPILNNGTSMSIEPQPSTDEDGLSEFISTKINTP
jgi:hypothetical protein